MKKIFKLAAIACAAVLFVSCGAKDDKTLVKEVMESYMSASLSMDFATLKSIVTPESVAAIDQMEQAMKNLPEEAVNAAKEASKGITLDAESIVVNGEAATANMNAMGMNVPISLKKVDGKWLIDLAPAAPVQEVEVVDTTAVDTTAVDTAAVEAAQTEVK